MICHAIWMARMSHFECSPCGPGILTKLTGGMSGRAGSNILMPTIFLSFTIPFVNVSCLIQNCLSATGSFQSYKSERQRNETSRKHTGQVRCNWTAGNLCFVVSWFFVAIYVGDYPLAKLCGLAHLSAEHRRSKAGLRCGLCHRRVAGL